MYVVTKDGRKLPVDDSSIDYENDHWLPFVQNVGLYTDSTVLKEVWILELYKDNSFGQVGLKGKKDFEFVCEYSYKHEPTQEEILYRMSENGLSRHDIVIITKGYELDEYFDE